MAASGSVGKVTDEFNRRDYYLKEKFLMRIDRPSYDAYVPLLDKELESDVGYLIPTWEQVTAAATHQ